MNQTSGQLINITPDYISGLTQTDGSFSCSLKSSKSCRFGIQFSPEFNISAEIGSKHVLELIQKYFGCGIIYTNPKTNSALFVVTKLSDIYTIILPHFIKYPVYCAKLHAFKLFTKIVSALYNKEMKSLEERRELLRMALSMNPFSNRKSERINLLWSHLSIYEDKDKYLINLELPNPDQLEIKISDQWITGAIDGDGSFYVSFGSNGSIIPTFTFTNDTYSFPLINSIKNRLNGIGSISKVKDKNAIRYKITSLKDMITHLIPMIDNSPLISERADYYYIFKKVCLKLNELTKQKVSLETKLELVELAYDSNGKGSTRKLSKSEYILLLKQLHQ